MLHEHDATTSESSRGITRAGRTSARVEAQIAANMDTIAIASTLEAELAKRLAAQVRQLHVCRKLENDLCQDCMAIKALRHEINAVKAARVRENHALCAGETIAL